MRHLKQFSKQKVLVTGASGFIGSHLCQALAEGSAEIHAVSRSVQTGRQGAIYWWQEDLADMAAVRRLVKTVRPDVIFHLASYVSGEREMEAVLPTFQNNLMSTLNLLIATTEEGCRRIVLAGSLEEPDSEAVPCSPYAAAKGAGTAYARMFHSLYKTPVVITRLFMVYGPGQQCLQKLVPSTILSLLRNEPVRLSSGQRLVDWIYVKDTVSALLAAAQTPGIEGSTLDLGSGKLAPIRSVVECLAGLVNPKGQLLYGALPERPMEQIRVASVAETRRKIEWQPVTSLEDGLKQTAAWYRERFMQGEIAGMSEVSYSYS